MEKGENRIMPKYTQNTGKQWTSSEILKLKTFAKQNLPTRVIGLKLGRTPDAVYKKASQENISLQNILLHHIKQSPLKKLKWFWNKDNYIRNLVLQAILLIIILLILNKIFPFISIINKEASYYLFSSAAQTIAAFIGLLIAGYAFIYSKMDKDETSEDTELTIMIRYFRYIKILGIITLLAILLNFYALIINEANIPGKSLIYIFALLTTILAVVSGITFIFEITNPDKYKKEAENISRENTSIAKSTEETKYLKNINIVNLNSKSRFIEDFIKLERMLRLFFQKTEHFKKVDLYNFTSMCTMLLRQGLIDNDIYHRFLTITKYRNLVIHGHINEIDSEIARDLRRLLGLLRDILK